MQVKDIAVKLTEKEEKVLTFYIQGKNRKLIAQDLGIKPSTVSVHLKNAKKKIGNENLPTFLPRVNYADKLSHILPVKTEEKSECDQLKETLSKDPGLVRMLYDAHGHGEGLTTRDKGMALATTGVGAYRSDLMRENGKTFMIMSKSRHCKIMRLDAERRKLASRGLSAAGVKPVRVSVEGDAEYIVTPSELAKIRANI